MAFPIGHEWLNEIHSGFDWGSEVLDKTQSSIDAVDGYAHYAANLLENYTGYIDELSPESKEQIDAIFAETFGDGVVTVQEIDNEMVLLSNITNEAIETFEKMADRIPFDEYDNIFDYYKEFESLWNNSCRVGASIAAIVIIVYTILPGFTFYRLTMALRRPDGSKPRAAVNYMLQRKIPKLVGLQYSTAVYGFYLASGLITFLIALLCNKYTWEYLWQLLDFSTASSDVQLTMSSLFGSVVMYVLQYLIFDPLIFENLYSDGYWIKKPLCFNTCFYIMILYGIYTGQIVIFTRIITGFCYMAMSLLRIDICIFPEVNMTADTGYTCFLSTLNFFHRCRPQPRLPTTPPTCIRAPLFYAIKNGKFQNHEMIT